MCVFTGHKKSRFCSNNNNINITLVYSVTVDARFLLHILKMVSNDQLGESVEHLKQCLLSLNTSVNILSAETQDVGSLKKLLKSETVFDLLPERVVLQRPLKIRKVVKPVLEKDLATVDELLNRFKKRKQVLQQQSKIMKLKLETISN